MLKWSRLPRLQRLGVDQTTLTRLLFYIVIAAWGSPFASARDALDPCSSVERQAMISSLLLLAEHLKVVTQPVSRELEVQVAAEISFLQRKPLPSVSGCLQ